MGWSIYVAVTTYQFSAAGVPHALLMTSLAAFVGVTLTHAFRRTARQRGWLGLAAGALAPRIIFAALGLAIVYVLILLVMERLVYGKHSSDLALTALFAIIRWTMVFFIWLAIYFGYGLIERRREGEIRQLRAEKALQTAELRSLRSQLNPHFLFNSLNSIRALVVDDPALAQDAITRTARILRYALESGREQTVSLGRELEIVEDYLALEALRLQDRLRVERRISDDVKHLLVPIMMVQLLVENALKHGIAQLSEGGALRISAGVSDGIVDLEVENPRPRLAAAIEGASPGIGLANVADRLRLLFGPTAEFALDLSAAERATARIRIPARRAEPRAEQ